MKNKIKEIQEFVSKGIMIPLLESKKGLSNFEEWQEIVKFYFTEKIDQKRVDLLASEIDLINNKSNLTLARILNAITEIDDFQLFGIPKNGFITVKQGIDTVFIWQLLNKDGSEATFQDQSEKTQVCVAKLLGYEGASNE